MDSIKDLDKKDFFQVLWNYFAFHANQRIQVFNFYIILMCCLITAFCAISQLTNYQNIYQSVICLFILLFSITFLLFDCRTKTMIKIVEESIMYIENQYKEDYGKEIMIFSKEKEKTNIYRSKYKIRRMLSYSIAFYIIYISFAAIGIVGIIISCLKII